VLTDPQWGTRNTSENWANNAWPFLRDFQKSNAQHIANRAFEIYGITGAYHCGRGMSEYSMQWTTPDEQDRFDAMFEEISSYAGKIDNTMDKARRAGKWNDFGLTLAWVKFQERFPKLPKFNLRTDVEGESGKIPVRTGVYIPQDDPHGALQFAWTGGGHGELIGSNTFNTLGLDALNTIGRNDLWLDNNKMFEFATSPKYAQLFKNEVFFRSQPEPELAPSAIALEAFTSRPCKWYYVELISGEFEDIDDTPISTSPQNRLRIEGGQPCPQTGYWFTPAHVNSRRHFKERETMPIIGSDYGATVWQWDPNQSA
jgi:hypothetical protein